MARTLLRGGLRIGNGLAFPGARRAGGPATASNSSQPPYIEALVKLFPVEGVTLAPMIGPIAAGDGRIIFWLTLAVVSLIVLLRRAATMPQNGGAPDWTAIAVSVVSFLLYAATLQTYGLFFGSEERHTLLMSFITIIWVAAVPLIPRR